MPAVRFNGSYALLIVAMGFILSGCTVKRIDWVTVEPMKEANHFQNIVAEEVSTIFGEQEYQCSHENEEVNCQQVVNYYIGDATYQVTLREKDAQMHLYEMVTDFGFLPSEFLPDHYKSKGIAEVCRNLTRRDVARCESY